MLPMHLNAVLRAIILFPHHFDSAIFIRAQITCFKKVGWGSFWDFRLEYCPDGIGVFCGIF